jgi:hypothetical protein
MKRYVGCVVLLLLVAGCTKPRVYATDSEVSRASYRHYGPPSLTLYTMVNNRTGNGAHSALMINASERVIFDPAGSFYSDVTPERHDVLFGISPSLEFGYRSAHARSTYHVLSQSVDVSPAQAQTAYRLALQSGPVMDAFCASATSQLLNQVPGFESIRSTMSPNKLAAQFEEIPGVTSTRYYEDDNPDLETALEQGVVLQNTDLTQ